jgi:hypothetical protein
MTIATGLAAGAAAAWLARRLIAALHVGSAALAPGGVAISTAMPDQG